MIRYLAVMLVVMTGLIPIRGASSQVNCQAQTTSLSDPLTKAVWDEYNLRRANTFPGYPALSWSDDLAKSAAWMAEDRANRLTTSNSETDSLGRGSKQRAVDCSGYTGSVAETSIRLWATHPAAVMNLWQGGDAVRMYWALRSGAPPPDSNTYTQAALGRYQSSVDGAYYWVLDLGTGSQAPTHTPTRTPVVVPTATATATATRTPTPEPVTLEGTNCEITEGSVDTTFSFECRG